MPELYPHSNYNKVRDNNGHMEQMNKLLGRIDHKIDYLPNIPGEKAN